MHSFHKKPIPPVPLEDWMYPAIFSSIALLVILGGIVAGLTIGLMSIDKTNLSIIMRSGDEKSKRYARSLIPIIENQHLLLVCLLLTNTIVNETLPVLFHSVHLDGYQAVLVSTALIVVFGEIIPQAVCARYGLAIGYFFAYPVRFLMFILFPIAYPIAKLLDLVLGKKHGVVYKRQELKELVDLHAGILNVDEVGIVKAVLDLRDKTVLNVMVL